MAKILKVDHNGNAVVTFNNHLIPLSHIATYKKGKLDVFNYFAFQVLSLKNTLWDDIKGEEYVV